MTLWQTCFSSFVGEKVSVRLSRKIDERARLIFFVDYVIAIITIAEMPKNQAGVEALNIFGYVNALGLMLAILIWARVLHNQLQNALIYDPLTVYHETTEDMDTNEVATLYGILDKNGDEQVTVETIVRALMVDMHKNSGETSVAVKRKQEAELVALCKKKIAESNGDDVSPLLHREAFEDNYKNIFGEALAYKIRHDAMRKKGTSLSQFVGKSVRRISTLGNRKQSLTTSSTEDCDDKEDEGSSGAVRKKRPSKNGFDSLESERSSEYAPSPEALRIKKRPSRNAQILDSWNGEITLGEHQTTEAFNLGEPETPKPIDDDAV